MLLCVHVCMHVRVLASMHVVYAYVHVYAHVCSRVYVCAHVHVRMACMRTCCFYDSSLCLQTKKTF